MRGLTVDGWAVSPEYANQLKTWVSGHPDQFEADEGPRAQRAAAYLVRRANRPNPRGNIAGLRAAILTAIALLLMLTPAITMAAAYAHAAGQVPGTPPAMPSFYVTTPVLVLLATAVTSSRMPTWLRVIALVVGLFTCLLLLISWPVTMGQIGGEAEGSVLCSLGAIATLIVAIAIGGRR